MPTVILILLILSVVFVAAAQLAANKPLSWIAIGLAVLTLLVYLLGPKA